MTILPVNLLPTTSQAAPNSHSAAHNLLNGVYNNYFETRVSDTGLVVPGRTWMKDVAVVAATLDPAVFTGQTTFGVYKTPSDTFHVMADFGMTQTGDNFDSGAGRFVAAQASGHSAIRAIESHVIRYAPATLEGTWAHEYGVHTNQIGNSVSYNLGLYIAASHQGWITGPGVRCDTGVLVTGEDGWYWGYNFYDTDGTTQLFGVNLNGIIIAGRPANRMSLGSGAMAVGEAGLWTVYNGSIANTYVMQVEEQGVAYRPLYLNPNGGGTKLGGPVTVPSLGAGVGHLDSSGVLTSSPVVAADITTGTITATQIAARTRSVFVPATQFMASQGSPTLAVSATGAYYEKMPAWYLDGTVDESLCAFYELPADWDGGAITHTIQWAPTDGSGGNVYWSVQTANIAAGAAISKVIDGNDGQIAPAGSTTDLLKELGIAVVTPTSRNIRLTLSRLGSQALDTYNGHDVYMVAVRVDYTADM